MACVGIAGAEVDVVTGGVDANAITQTNGTVTRDTGTKRSGAASWKTLQTAGSCNAYVSEPGLVVSTGISKTFFWRVYMRVAAAPPATADVIFFEGMTVRLTTGLALQFIRQSGTQAGSDSSALSLDTWYRVELMCVINASAQITSAELRLDGTTVGSFSGATDTGGSANRFGIGVNAALASAGSTSIFWDDFQCNDATGAANNTWVGASNVILMLPISDNNRGAWVAGLGSTTNLFDGVNNTPPVGVAEASATNTSQIKNRSATNPTNCDLNLDTYTNAGVTGTVNAIRVCEVDGEDPATGTKAGTCSMVSNPAIGPSASFNFGDDAGLQGTYVGLWKTHQVISDAPTVTLGTAPVIRITCTSGATTGRSASCCFLGAYVAYTPPSLAPPPMPHYRKIRLFNR
jgi:hypothetical protein